MCDPEFTNAVTATSKSLTDFLDTDIQSTATSRVWRSSLVGERATAKVDLLRRRNNGCGELTQRLLAEHIATPSVPA